MGGEVINDLVANRWLIERRFRKLRPVDEEMFFTTGSFIEKVKDGSSRVEPSPWLSDDQQGR